MSARKLENGQLVMRLQTSLEWYFAKMLKIKDNFITSMPLDEERLRRSSHAFEQISLEWYFAKMLKIKDKLFNQLAT